MGHAGRVTNKTLHKIVVMGPQLRKHTKASTSRTTGRNTCWPHALLSHRRAIRCHLANSSTSPTGGHKRELCTCPEPQGENLARKLAAMLHMVYTSALPPHRGATEVLFLKVGYGNDSLYRGTHTTRYGTSSNTKGMV